MAHNLVEITQVTTQIDEDTQKIELDIDYSFWKLFGLVYTSAVFVGTIARFVVIARGEKEGA